MTRITSKDLSRAKANGGKFAPNEGKLADQVCRYLKLAYPRVLFKIDYGAGAILTGQQAAQQRRMQSVRGWPDLFVAEPRHNWAGLYIELKREGEKVYKRNGLFSSDHIEDQAAVHRMLMDRGFYACFAVGFDKAKQLIDDWFNVHKLMNFQRKPS